MRALITGINGQDGWYLSRLLLDEGYEVFGLDPYRPHRTPVPGVTMVKGDLTDPASLFRVMREVKPTEVYNLGAMSFVGDSWAQPMLTAQVNAIGTLNLLEAADGIPFYQASTSEMFGSSPPPQNEDTKFHPRSPYGVAKLFAHHICVNYRESYGWPISCGILFNHESPKRGEQFVTRKVAKAVAEIKAGVRETVELGNLDAKRDWGCAGDFVDAMWLMLQNEPDDFVIATGQLHSVEEMVDIAFSAVGLSWEDHVVINPDFIRPAEVDALCGDYSKAKRILDWQPVTTFKQMIEEMVDAEMRNHYER